MHLMDTAGQEDYAELRVLGLKDADCFLMCFSVADKVTFRNIEDVWLPEIRSRNSKAKILLVGTKADLRKAKGHRASTMSMRGKGVSWSSIERCVTKQKLDGYVETSSKQKPEQLDAVFEKAVRLGLGLVEEGEEANIPCCTVN